MKPVGGLFDQISARQNLAAALWEARRCKRQSAEAMQFSQHADDRLQHIGELLRRGKYQFSAYRCFAVQDTKTRLIHAPCFQDRVVHQAIIRVTAPVFEHAAMPHSYACLKNRGQHRAVQQLRNWLRRSQWYGKVDVQKFYDSVDHATLIRLLARRFRERRLLGLFESLLNSYCHTPGAGIPIGALTSQWFGNFYLDEADRHLLAAGTGVRYLRYMDDMLLIGSRQQVESARPVLLNALYQLKLVAKHGGDWNRAAQGVPWLGFTVYPDRVRLNRKGRSRLNRKLKSLNRLLVQDEIDEFDYQARVTALFAHAQHATDSTWRRGLLARHEVERVN